jgi:hypothetical protein
VRSLALEGVEEMYFFLWPDNVVTYQEMSPTYDQLKITGLSVFYYDDWKLYQVFAVDDIRPYRGNFIVPESAFEFGLPKIRFSHIGENVEIPNVFAQRRKLSKLPKLTASSYVPRPSVGWV